ncbi:MAG: hypothetical protein ABJB03_02080 [Rhodoglobus sp.]
MKAISFVSIGALGSLALLIGAQPAFADDGATNGWTEEETVAAAVKMGLDEDWVRQAWEDGLYESIPVSVGFDSQEESRPLTAEETATFESRGDVVPLAVVSTSHDQIWYNSFGGALTRITMNKSFNANGVSVSAISDNITTGSGFDWYFNGIVNDWDAYSTEGGRANGGHTSYTMGLFCNDVPAPTCVNQWVQIKGLWNGSAVKSGG